LLRGRLGQAGIRGVEALEAPTPVRGRVGSDELSGGHSREHELFWGEASQQPQDAFLGRCPRCSACRHVGPRSDHTPRSTPPTVRTIAAPLPLTREWTHRVCLPQIPADRASTCRSRVARRPPPEPTAHHQGGVCRDDRVAAEYPHRPRPRRQCAARTAGHKSASGPRADTVGTRPARATSTTLWTGLRPATNDHRKTIRPGHHCPSAVT